MEFKSSFQKLKELLIEDLSGLEGILVAASFSIVLLILFIFLSRWIQKQISKRLNDALLVDFIGGSVKSLILIFGLILVLRFLGLTGVVSGLLAGAGITAFIIGFALKDIGKNFLAGILLAFKRPFKVGDIVEINNIRGRVLSLNLRDTHIKTADGKDVFMPNASIIKNPLTNFTIDGFLSYSFVIGVDYGSDYSKVLHIIEKNIYTVKGILTKSKKPSVNISEMGSNTLNITVSYWVNTYDKVLPDVKVRSNAILTVLTALEKEGINLPGNIIELKNHSEKPFLQQEQGK